MSSIVRVPKTSVINVKAVSADIEVDVTNVNLEITTVSGDVTTRRNPTSRCNVKTVSGDMTSEISLDDYSDSTFESAGTVMISASTVSGDFSLARN